MGHSCHLLRVSVNCESSHARQISEVLIYKQPERINESLLETASNRGTLFQYSSGLVRCQDKQGDKLSYERRVIF